MRIISALCFLLSASLCFAQPDTSKVDISESCWGKPLPSPVVVLLPQSFTGKVAGLNIATTSQGVFRNERYSCRCIRTFSSDTLPLLIVDASICKLDTLSKINPNDISNVEILKSAASTALFGPDGVNGAIFITTKKSLLRKFIIKDFLDESRVAGATVLFTAIKDIDDRFQLVVNDSGVVETDKLKRKVDYLMTISSVGYTSVQQFFKNENNHSEESILMTREIRECEEAIISYSNCWNNGTTHFCKTSGIRITFGPEQKTEEMPELTEIKIFPNPVQKGKEVNIQFINKDNSKKIVRLISNSGQEIFRQKLITRDGKMLYQLSTDAHWPAGIYFIQVFYENGELFASDKIVIQ